MNEAYTKEETWWVGNKKIAFMKKILEFMMEVTEEI